MKQRNPTQLTGPLEKDGKMIVADVELSSTALGSPLVNPVLSLIHTTRGQLLRHRAYRKPYVKCLRSLYETGQAYTPAQLKRLNAIRPRKPTCTAAPLRDPFNSRSGGSFGGKDDDGEGAVLILYLRRVARCHTAQHDFVFFTRRCVPKRRLEPPSLSRLPRCRSRAFVPSYTNLVGSWSRGGPGRDSKPTQNRAVAVLRQGLERGIKPWIKSRKD